MSDPSLILIVDDDDEIRATLREILEYEGHEVLAASNGSQALAALRTGSRPCLILLDLMMPVMSGYAFRQAQLRDPMLASIPVIFLSAHAHGEQLDAEVIQKPFRLDRLLLAVEKACGRG